MKVTGLPGPGGVQVVLESGLREMLPRPTDTVTLIGTGPAGAHRGRPMPSIVTSRSTPWRWMVAVPLRALPQETDAATAGAKAATAMTGADHAAPRTTVRRGIPE